LVLGFKGAALAALPLINNFRQKTFAPHASFYFDSARPNGFLFDRLAKNTCSIIGAFGLGFLPE